MAKKEFCPHCGQPVMRHRQNLSKDLCEILLTVALKFPAEQPFHLQRDLTLTKSQYNNFQKLRYWGLVKKTFLDGKRVGGFWELTGLAGPFMRGKKLPRIKWTFNNQVVGSEDDDLITMVEAVGEFEIPELWANVMEVHIPGQLNIFDRAIDKKAAI